MPDQQVRPDDFLSVTSDGIASAELSSRVSYHHTMIEIDRGYETIVEQLIQTGRFASAQEVIQAGIAQLAVDAIDLDDEEIDDATAASIERSEADIAAGRWGDP
jgi:Arc/MetJ-type ribon-helix-helix transcriptional regulator